VTIALLFVIACLACLAFIVYTENAKLERRIKYVEWFTGLGPTDDTLNNNLRLLKRIEYIEDVLGTASELIDPDSLGRSIITRPIRIDQSRKGTVGIPVKIDLRDKPKPGRPRKVKKGVQ
jgi:hypothetical protein